MVEVVGERHRVAAAVALAAALAGGALFGITWVAGFARVWESLRRADFTWAGAAVLAEVVAYLGYIVAYREVARAERGHNLDVPKVAALVTAGFAAFLDGGGFALDRAALKQAGLGDREARARVLGLGALEYAVLAPATMIAAGVVLARGLPISSSLTLPWVIGVPTGTVLALCALHWKQKLVGGRRRRKHIAHRLRALELVLSLLRDPRKHGLAFVGITLYWLGDIGCLWSALHVFDAHTPPVAQLIVGYATGYAITRRALPLGGAGIVEALLPFALGWVEISLAPAVAAVFLYRLINLWLPMVPAIAALPALRDLRGCRSES